MSSESTIACPQKSDWYDPWEVEGQEDCLFLNIYSTENHQQGPLPVMVWIHGGALLAGSGTFQRHGPQHLLDREVVLVTVNYRLGALGFLCIGNDQVSTSSNQRAEELHLVSTRSQEMLACATKPLPCTGSRTTLANSEEILPG